MKPCKQTYVINAKYISEQEVKYVNTPLYRGSTVVFDTIEKFVEINALGMADKSYGRGGTPNVHHLETILAHLDDADHALILPSGLCAITTAIMSFINSKCHILVSNLIYGPTRRFIDEELVEKLGIEVTYYPPEISSEIKMLIKENTNVIFMESPASNTFEIQDLAAICQVAQQHDIVTILDNTWAFPLLCNPFKWGVDVCTQSLTKYANGHSDVILGAITFQKKHYKKLYSTVSNYGSIASPEICSLLLRGLKTLYPRLQQHEKSGLVIANWLNNRPEVATVLHPALPDFPYHRLWKKYYTGSHGLLSFILKPGFTQEQAFIFINSLKIFKIGLSWGCFESLVVSVDINKTDVARQNILVGQCIRLHVGLEDVEDLTMDLSQAFEELII